MIQNRLELENSIFGDDEVLDSLIKSGFIYSFNSVPINEEVDFEKTYQSNQKVKYSKGSKFQSEDEEHSFSSKSKNTLTNN